MNGLSGLRNTCSQAELSSNILKLLINERLNFASTTLITFLSKFVFPRKLISHFTYELKTFIFSLSENLEEYDSKSVYYKENNNNLEKIHPLNIDWFKLHNFH